MTQPHDPAAAIRRPLTLARSIVAASRLPRSHPPPGQRIVILGTSGSGKSTLARTLASRLALDHIELDAENWLPGWSERPLAEFRARVGERAAGERWVVDGNYRSRVRDIVWPRADTIVWLDPSFPRVMRQVLQRTVRRAVRKELLWGTNRESWRKACSTDSIVLWSLTTWSRRREQNTVTFQSETFAHTTRIQLRSRRECDAWLERWTGAPLDRSATRS